MNIHLPAILMFTRGTRFWHTAIYAYDMDYQSLSSFEKRLKLQFPGTNFMFISILKPNHHEWFIALNRINIFKTNDYIYLSIYLSIYLYIYILYTYTFHAKSTQTPSHPKPQKSRRAWVVLSDHFSCSRKGDSSTTGSVRDATLLEVGGQLTLW